MKVIVTGHTSGIGRSLFNKFKHLNHTVIGFSRFSGFDISDTIVRKQILDFSKDSDIFINNAWHITGQIAMLQSILETPVKNIINISSNIKSLPETFFTNQAVIDYRDSKLEIDTLIDNYIGSINILNVLPELTNTNFNLGLSSFDLTTGMDSDYVADVIYEEFNSNPNNKEFVIKHWQWMRKNNLV